MITNTIEFEVMDMTQSEEEIEIKRLSTLIDSQKGIDEQDKYARELSFLNGEAATIDKAKRLLNSRKFQGDHDSYMYDGLFKAKNKTPAIKLYEEAFNDLNREIRSDIISTLVQLKFSQEIDLHTIDESDIAKLNELKKNRYSEIEQFYLQKLFESLPDRVGNNKLIAAFTIFTRLPKEDASSEVFNTTKNLILEKFEELNPWDQNTLLESNWAKLKTPLLIPLIEKSLSNSQSVRYLNKTTALKRLIELDKKRARPFVIAEIRNFDSSVSLEVLISLDDKFLTEVDDALLENIKRAAPINIKNRDYQITYMKSLLAARYATAKIYKPLMEIYKTNEQRWLKNASCALLGYFARHNDKEAMNLVEERLSKFGGVPNVFYDLAKMNFTKGMEKLLKKHFESNDPFEAGSSAYFLSKYGGKDNRKLIQNRYNQWLKEWKPRAVEFDKSDASKNVLAHRMFQVEISQALINAKAWKLTEKEIIEIKQNCLSEMCRTYFPAK